MDTPKLEARRSAAGALLLALLVLGSCGEGEPKVMMPIQSVVASLVDDGSAREVELENEAAPVVAGTYAPSAAFRHDSSPLPALRMVPPARVRLKVGKLPAGARMRFGIGFDGKAYEGADGGRVRFRIGDDWRWFHEETMPFGKGVPAQQRVWHLHEIEVGSKELLIETELVEGSGTPPAAFASLQVVTTNERPRERASKKTPNVVLVMLDTERRDRLSCYGGRPGLTPTLDALAARGVLFENAFAASSWTWPSTASLLTSLTVAEHGLESHRACYLSQRLLTIAEAFQAAGWTTGAISSNPLVHADKGFGQGFETFEHLEWRRASQAVERATRWLHANGEWRFFLFLLCIDPHEYKPAEEFLDRWAGPPPEGYRPEECRELYVRMLAGEEHDAARLRELTDYNSRLYDASLAEFDAALGKLIEELAALGQLDDTVIVFTSDHGEEFLEHGTLYHGNNLHRELTGIPLILAGPGIPVGVRVAERAENRFLAPTLLELVGVEPLDNLRGPSLLDLDQVRTVASEPMFLSTRRGVWLDGDGPALPRLVMHGVRVGDRLFLWVPETEDGTPRRALYDLAADPAEQHDLSAAYPEQCDRYEAMIERWLERSARVRPDVLDGGESAIELLQKIGYLDK